MTHSSRINDIQPFHVMALLARAKELESQGKDIIHMEIGEPDFPTPQPIVDAGIKAIKSGDVHYTPALGLPELRQAIAQFYKTRYEVQVSSSRVVITPGASGALMLALGTIMLEGDEVLLADPGYPCNRNFVRFLSGKIGSIAVDASSAYQLSLKHIQENWSDKSKVVIVASPSNPTGTLLEKTELVAMAEFIKERGGYLIVDEIYHGLIYDDEVSTAVTLNENIIVINSFSKYFNMTGWRLGWAIMPETLVSNADKLAQNIFLAPSTPAQYAALAAFSNETKLILESYKNDIAQLRAAMDSTNHPALLMVDCIASLGSEEFEMDAWGVDVMVAGCQKGLMTPPGVAFTFHNERAAEISNSSPRTSPYWSWQPRTDPERFYMRFAGTPPTHHLFGLSEALKMMLDEEGLTAAWARHTDQAEAVWAAVDIWAEAGAIRCNVPNKSHRSSAVTTVVSDTVDLTPLHRWCSEKAGLILGIGIEFGDVESTQIFRIGHMGHMNPVMLLGALSSIDAGLKALDIPHGNGAVEAAGKILAR